MRFVLLLLALATHTAAAQSAAAQPVPVNTLEARMRAFVADLGTPRPDTRLGWDDDALVRSYEQHINRDVTSVETETAARYDRRSGLLTLDALPRIETPPQVAVKLSWFDIEDPGNDRLDGEVTDRSTPPLRGTATRPAVRLDAAAWRALAPQGETRIPSTVRLSFTFVPPSRPGTPFSLFLTRLRWTPRGGAPMEWEIGPPPPPPAPPRPRSDAPPPSPPPPPTPPPYEDDEVFDFAETQPEIIGGMEALQAAVSYPDEARTSGIEGRVVLQFVVSETGQPTQVQVVRPVSPLLDAAAVEAVRATRFTPGKTRGRPVRVRMTIPITFRLQ